MIDIFIPSYHRPQKIKTANYFIKNGWPPNKVHVIIDNEADDREEYKAVANKKGFHLHVFNIEDARQKYDFIHRPSVSRRAAGMSRNMFYEYAGKKGIDFYCVIDDDTNNYQIRPFQRYIRKANYADINYFFESIKEIMIKHKIGLFGISQTGDAFEKINKKLLRSKVMNTTFYYTPYIYWGERGVQNDDTSQFATVLNEGYFTGSLASGIYLNQTQSATQEGGLTDLYRENKLLNKALVPPIQFPSAICANRQKRNGGRLHHKIQYRYLMPKLMKGKRNNIAWDTYPEDVPFSNLFPRENHVQ